MSDEHKKSPAKPSEAPLHGLLAEYDTPPQLVQAAKKIRDAGFTKWDTYSPFAVHGIDDAMGIKMTVLPWFVLCAGLTGLATAITLQWWTNAVDYPWIISGKPMWSIPANVPIMFELTVLLSAITTLVGMLLLNNLPLPSHPLDQVRRFARVTDDKFFLMIQASDPKFDDVETRELLEATHPVAIEAVNEDHTTDDKLPSGLVYALIIVAVASIVPFALAAKARYTKSSSTRIHIIQDMDSQPKYKAQRENPFFADNRATRPAIDGTVAVGDARDDDHFYKGKVGNDWARTFPTEIALDEATMDRGRQRFGIYCTPCHGQVGQGDGMVAKRADQLAQGTWVPPSNITQENLRQMPVGELFNSITNGVRNMPAYGPQIKTEDRWAIIMYVRALQRSRSGSLNDLPPDARASLK
ncbi:MAG TPA: quinol:electron acceptor oxidoreductase subunit ActD [Polyangiaceae bacterium]|jgi:mono/diheme cytochrome c family protein|nr:quinol:electron acceptor oxidoreductase subunit ActD [Polyangiaceae bacterium]